MPLFTTTAVHGKATNCIIVIGLEKRSVISEHASCTLHWYSTVCCTGINSAVQVEIKLATRTGLDWTAATHHPNNYTSQPIKMLPIQILRPFSDPIPFHFRYKPCLVHRTPPSFLFPFLFLILILVIMDKLSSLSKIAPHCPFLRRTRPSSLHALSTSASPRFPALTKLTEKAIECPVMGATLAKRAGQQVQSFASFAQGVDIVKIHRDMGIDVTSGGIEKCPHASKALAAARVAGELALAKERSDALKATKDKGVDVTSPSIGKCPHASKAIAAARVTEKLASAKKRSDALKATKDNGVDVTSPSIGKCPHASKALGAARMAEELASAKKRSDALKAIKDKGADVTSPSIGKCPHASKALAAARMAEELASAKRRGDALKATKAAAAAKPSQSTSQASKQCPVRADGFNYDKFYSDELQKKHDDKSYRHFNTINRLATKFPIAHTANTETEVEVWCANDYLGMGNNPVVLETMQ